MINWLRTTTLCKTRRKQRIFNVIFDAILYTSTFKLLFIVYLFILANEGKSPLKLYEKPLKHIKPWNTLKKKKVLGYNRAVSKPRPD